MSNIRLIFLGHIDFEPFFIFYIPNLLSYSLLRRSRPAQISGGKLKIHAQRKDFERFFNNSTSGATQQAKQFNKQSDSTAKRFNLPHATFKTLHTFYNGITNHEVLINFQYI